MIGIYCIENILTGLKYIGSSNDIERRWLEHQSELGRGDHHNKHLQNSYNKHGKEFFKYSVILECEEKDMIFYESYLVDSNLDNLYNHVAVREAFGKKSKPILQFDMMTMEFINEFDSIKSAVELFGSGVKSALRAESFSNGYIWIYKDKYDCMSEKDISNYFDSIKSSRRYPKTIRLEKDGEIVECYGIQGCANKIGAKRTNVGVLIKSPITSRGKKRIVNGYTLVTD